MILDIFNFEEWQYALLLKLDETRGYAERAADRAAVGRYAADPAERRVDLSDHRER
jgi:hypothetical protein